jgi:23S rRNA (pseudouridine1915-N3)-methyltransferase
MKWRIIHVGKPALAFAKAGVADYAKRLGHYTTIERVALRSGSREEIAKRCGPRQNGHVRLVLDERGETLTTSAFAAKVEGWQLAAIKSVDCFIGGADGHSQDLRQEADLVLGLSAFTLQHELAMVVWLEQLYRVHTLLRGEPYHR